jgi:hypothetical protein
MPFGLKNAGATYQRMMQNCLGSLIGWNIQVYIDNVVITTRKEEALISDLKETFNNLDRYKLKLNPTKCSFGVSTGQLLGFLVSARGIEANPEKIQEILTMGKPAKLHEVQQLVGRVAALSRFVARLGEKALPFDDAMLRHLVGNPKRKVWGAQQQVSLGCETKVIEPVGESQTSEGDAC